MTFLYDLFFVVGAIVTTVIAFCILWALALWAVIVLELRHRSRRFGA